MEQLASINTKVVIITKKQCHAIEVILHTTQNAAEQATLSYLCLKQEQKSTAKIFQNVMLLTHQNIALRGDQDESDSNFNHLVDECTDSSNHEQLLTCFQVDCDLEVHEEFLGIYEISIQTLQPIPLYL